MWELCSGSKTVAGAFADCGWQTFTLDIEKGLEPDHVGDLLNYDYWDLVRISGFKPDFIWFSPPCTVYSMANIGSNHWKKNYDGNVVPATPEAKESNRFVLHGIDIINASEAAYSVVENPRGMLRTQSMMKQLPRETVTYCQYGHPNQKPTDLWGHFPYSWSPKMCKPESDCHESSPRRANKFSRSIKTAYERGIVPEALALDLCFTATRDFPMRRGLVRWQ